MTDIDGRPFFCSWSGGKDACLALYLAQQAGGRPAFLLTMLEDDGSRSRGHGIPPALIERQAQLLDVPLAMHATTWDGYRDTLLEALAEFKSQGITDAVFGDIELEEHRVWINDVCREAGFEAHLPLWCRTRADLADELLDAGFKATVVAVREDTLDKRFLGREVDRALLDGFTELGIDIMGEDGEYHTVVTDGPLFSSPLVLKAAGETQENGHWMLQMALA
jgi:diphthine-ammonia ligase